MSKSSKKNTIVLCLLLSFVIVALLPSFSSGLQEDEPFVVGTGTNPPKLDPQDQYDSESAETIGQVCEGLYRYNYSSSEMEPIPQLATAIGTVVGNEALGYNYTVTLRNDVTFHDGTPFNASAVKWTFDRIAYLSYGLWEDGVLITKAVTLMESYSIFAHSGVPILNSTFIEGEFVIRFELNTAPGFFEQLLAFMATQMMLPDENYVHGAKFAGFLGLNEDLIGTGPYELVEYVYDNQVVFKAYEDYYLSRPDNYIKNMIYLIVPDGVARSQAILNHEIHWGPVLFDFDDNFTSDPFLIELETKACVVFYIQMNMFTMPQEVRIASAFAYNYSYLVEERASGNVLYLHSPVPDGMQYHLKDFSGEPYTNLTYARMSILSCPELAANISITGLSIANSTEEWRNVAESSYPLAWYNFTGYSGLYYHYLQLEDNLKNIGIRLSPLIIYWGWWYWLDWHDEEFHKRLSYSFGGWGPDYNDPINMIEPLYGRNAEGGPASANIFLLDDSQLNNLLNETYYATDSSNPTRKELFHEMQQYIAAEIVPSFYIYQRKSSISFNRKFVNETSVGDMMNAYSDYYWFNVQFYPRSSMSIFWEENRIYFLIVGISILGVTFVSLSMFFGIKYGKRIIRNMPRFHYCPDCGMKYTDTGFCRVCGQNYKFKNYSSEEDQFKL